MDKKVNRPEEEKKKGKPDDLPYNPEITSEDKQALNEKGKSMNKGQDAEKNRQRDGDYTANELDVPASNANKPGDRSELVDEENMQYNKRGAREDHEKAKDHPGSSKKI